MPDLTGLIAALYIYPIKSCAGLRVQDAQMTPRGLLHDRQWLIVDQDGRFQTQRQIPHLVWITPTIDGQTLTLCGPNQPDLTLPILVPDQHHRHTTRTIQVWNDRLPATDMGLAASQWLNEYLQVPGKTFHLVQFDARQTRLSDPHWTGEQPATVQFADGFAINVISEASLTLFNDKLITRDVEPVGADRFRPNVVLTGLAAHDEDNIQTIVVPAPGGPIEWALVKPCSRCQIPDINPQTAMREPEVTAVLSTYRQHPQMDHAICFGMNGVVRQGAGLQLAVGQSFEAELNV